VSSVQRIGVFGGTFDPPHVTHVELVRAAVRTLELEAVVVLVTGSPPHHKQPVAPPDVRLSLVTSAFGDVPQVIVDDRELRRPDGIHAYTVESLEQLHDEHPDAQLVLLVGADQAAALHTWRRWQDIRHLALIGIAGRDPVHDEGLARIVAELTAEGAKVELIDMEKSDAASHLIRELLTIGDEAATREWLPERSVDATIDVYRRLLPSKSGVVG
jgi:nicotinate-nucleotide adenylyltransferase